MLTRSFYFLRHGETDWNKQGLMQGHTDIPLNETGRLQARAAVEALSRLPIDRIVASPLVRAYETAEIVNRVLQKPLLTDGGIKERHFGSMEGMTHAEMDRQRSAWMADGSLEVEENGYPCPPEAEPYGVFKTRTIETLDKYLGDDVNGNVLFVAHGGVYRVLRRCLFSELDHSANAQPFYFEKVEEGLWRLVSIS
jgi:probable phosphoglycerate mutase